LRHDDHLNHHAPANLRGDDLYWDQMMDDRMLDDQMMDDRMKKRKGDWMGAMSYRVVFYHPFRTPLFKFNLVRYELYEKKS
jgi:hypothetical protein